MRYLVKLEGHAYKRTDYVARVEIEAGDEGLAKILAQEKADECEVEWSEVRDYSRDESPSIEVDGADVEAEIEE